MCIRLLFCLAAFVIALLGLTSPAGAQFARPAAGSPEIGEHYHVEFSTGLWNPTPNFIVSSESLGIPGSDIDFVNDLGIKKTRFGEIRFTGRPARKHKLRIQYVPIKYESSSTVTRDIVFNGQLYRVGLPVNSTIEWKAWRFGYEYDFLYRDQWFAGFIVEAKYTDVQVELDSVIGSEFARARAPIPAVGGIGRVYVAPGLSITGELTGFKLPASVSEEYRASYFDFDLYGTFNVTNNFGAQVGFRSLDIDYLVEEDAGALKLKGLYFSGVVRF